MQSIAKIVVAVVTPIHPRKNIFQNFCCCRRRLKGIQIRHKQDWGRGFILLLPQTAALPESDAGSGVI